MPCGNVVSRKITIASKSKMKNVAEYDIGRWVPNPPPLHFGAGSIEPVTMYPRKRSSFTGPGLSMSDAIGSRGRNVEHALNLGGVPAFPAPCGLAVVIETMRDR